MASPKTKPNLSPAYQGSMLMIVAPSGAGKSSLVNALLQEDAALKLSLSTTTRAPRPGEVDGKDYALSRGLSLLRSVTKVIF